MVSIYISLRANNVEHLFMSLFAAHLFSWWNVYGFACFLIGLFIYSWAWRILYISKDSVGNPIALWDGALTYEFWGRHRHAVRTQMMTKGQWLLCHSPVTWWNLEPIDVYVGR